MFFSISYKLLWFRLTHNEQNVATTEHRTAGRFHEAFFIVFKASEHVDVGRMNEVVTQIIQRHDALRTTFSLDRDGKLKQTIHPTADFEMKCVDLAHSTRAKEKAYEISLAANHAPNFRFDRSPILLMTLFNLGDDQWAFNTVIHHMSVIFPFILFHFCI